MVIVSTLSGRVRARSPRLKSARLAAAVETRLRRIEGVTQVQANVAAGSVLVHFDAAQIPGEALEDQLEQALLPPTREGAAGGPRLSATVNRVTKVGMMTTLGASMACAALGRKKPHIAFGAGFLAFAGLHLFRYSHRLLR